MALKNLEVIERLGLVGRVHSEIGPYLQRRMRETFEGHPIVGQGARVSVCSVPSSSCRDARERSFFPDPGNVGTHCRNYCFDSGPHHARDPRHDGVRPAAHDREAEVDELVAKAKDAIDRTAKDFGKM